MDVTVLKPLSGLYRRNAQRRSILRLPGGKRRVKIGKHNGGQLIQAPEERKPFAAVASDGAEAFPFLRNVLPGIGGCLHGAACTYDNSPDEDFIIDTLPAMRTRLSSLDSADMVLNSPRC